MSADYSVVMCRPCREPCDLTVGSSRYDILLCSETLVSDMRHVSELLVPEFDRCLVVPGQDASGLGDGGIRTRKIWSMSPTQV